jgi:hypothetical protein
MTHKVTMIDGQPSSVIQKFVGERLVMMHTQPEMAGISIANVLDQVRLLMDFAFVDLDAVGLDVDDFGYDGYKTFMKDVLAYSERLGFMTSDTTVDVAPHPIWVKLVIELAFKYLASVFKKAFSKKEQLNTVYDSWTRLSAKLPPKLDN